MEEELLLYGIAPAFDEHVLTSCRGVRGATVKTLRINSLAAIVSPWRDSDGKAGAEDLLAWHAVLDAVYRVAPVLPACFGLVAPGQGELLSLLERSRDGLERRLEALGDQGEFDVTVTWEPAVQARRIAEEIGEVRALVRGDGTTQEERIRAGRLVFEALEKRRAELARRFSDGLAEVATAQRELHRGDTIVHCSAYRAPKARFADFEARLHALGRELPEGARCRYAGPMAPYSFVGLSLTLVTAERVEGARALLDLPLRASPREIKAAYRKRSLDAHPDRHPEDPSARRRFQELTEAYRCLSGLAASAPDDKTTVALRCASNEPFSVFAMEEA